MTTSKELTRKINEMAPWHHKISLRDDVQTTGENNFDATGERVTQLNAQHSFDWATKAVIPDGMQGRSFLDCACNCGGYSFAAKNRGAGRTYGFDIRDHWINQAKFIQNHSDADYSEMQFERADLLDLADHPHEYDMTWFSGIFYHLPDPITGLKLAADRTKEFIFLNTACALYDPNVPEVPGLTYKMEGVEQLMSGVYGLSWVPTGPIVLKNILNWLGFPEAKTYFWVSDSNALKTGARKIGRVAVVGARNAGALDQIEEKHLPDEPQPIAR